MKVQGAIFDLDGTLLDSMSVWDTMGSDYLRDRGYEPEPGLDEKFKRMSIVDAAAYYQKVYGLTDTAEDIIDGINRRVEHFYTYEVLPKPGIPALLARMQELGIGMYVATATDRYLVEAALKKAGIAQYFAGILTCTEVGTGKEVPDIYEKALSLLGTEKQATPVFEDALHAIETAVRADFWVVGVYDASYASDGPAIRALVRDYVTSFDDWRQRYL